MIDATIRLDNEILEKVETTTYLGCTLIPDKGIILLRSDHALVQQNQHF